MRQTQDTVEQETIVAEEIEEAQFDDLAPEQPEAEPFADISGVEEALQAWSEGGHALDELDDSDEIKAIQFPQLDTTVVPRTIEKPNRLSNVIVDISVELGTKEMTVRELTKEFLGSMKPSAVCVADLYHRADTDLVAATVSALARARAAEAGAGAGLKFEPNRSGCVGFSQDGIELIEEGNIKESGRREAKTEKTRTVPWRDITWGAIDDDGASIEFGDDGESVHLDGAIGRAAAHYAFYIADDATESVQSGAAVVPSMASHDGFVQLADLTGNRSIAVKSASKR